MNWINNVVRPRIRSFLKPKDTGSENLWIKDPESGEMVFYRDLEANMWVVPNSNYHMKMKATDRLASFFDGGHYTKVAVPAVAQDPLKFRDSQKYTDRLKAQRQKTGTEDSVTVATGKLFGQEITAGVQDFDFMGGSLGMAAGSAIVTGLETAAKNKTPFVLFVASGGARMQEGILSLMQLPRTTVAVLRLREAGLPFIVVLTNPTTGGVTASYAMLGDIHLAEPGALIGFAGARVIEQTIREKLPKGFQRSEYLYDHGMVDMVVHRHDLRSTIGSLCGLLTKLPERPELAKGAPARPAAPKPVDTEAPNAPEAAHAE
ncbi:acetyl-CoA carboxylase, carboxyltransferase subunit beta [Devosia sp.]|uniref:acetyl-CoA carboxylase, carboxyltransferase subunit beta n=1 Tax=Devosia sp. TaxID=1871048 RepID=UPI003A93982C